MTTALALLAFAIGLFAVWSGTSQSSSWLTVAIAGLGAAYLALGGALAWHVYKGVPAEGYLSGKHGWLISSRKWLTRLLLWPIWLAAWPRRPLMRRLVASDLTLEVGERVRLVEWQADGDGLWAVSDRALHVGSTAGLFWRFPFVDVAAVADAPSGPWARTEVTVSLATPAGAEKSVSGLFTHEAAQRLTDRLTAAPQQRV